jgi:hypothetical protein
MNYTLEHLKIIYNAGAKKFPFNKTLELISLLGDGGIAGLLTSPDRGTMRSGLSTGKKIKLAIHPSSRFLGIAARCH